MNTACWGDPVEGSPSVTGAESDKSIIAEETEEEVFTGGGPAGGLGGGPAEGTGCGGIGGNGGTTITHGSLGDGAGL